MEEKKLITNIYHLAVVAAVFNVIMLFVSIYFLNFNAYALVSVYQVSIMMYILVQIESTCKALQRTTLISSTITRGMQKVSYACMINAIGTSILQSLLTSYYTKSISIHLSVTSFGVGVLLYVGAYVYQYGCNKKKEIGPTM